LDFPIHSPRTPPSSNLAPHPIGVCISFVEIVRNAFIALGLDFDRFARRWKDPPSGDQVLRFLNRIEDIDKMLEYFEKRGKVKKLGETLIRINHIVSKEEDLTSEDIAKLEADCKLFGETVRKFDNIDGIVKVHLLEAHLPKIAKQFKNLARFSESPIEISHRTAKHTNKRPSHELEHILTANLISNSQKLAVPSKKRKPYQRREETSDAKSEDTGESNEEEEASSEEEEKEDLLDGSESFEDEEESEQDEEEENEEDEA